MGICASDRLAVALTTPAPTGTGKTVMMLSLILATLDDLSAPEEAYHEERVPMTPLALRHFQTAAATAERDKLPKKGILPPPAYRDVGVPSLTELVVHQVCLRPNGLRLRDREDYLKEDHPHLWKALRRNVPFYLHTDPPRDVGWYTSRGGTPFAPKVMYLTTATLAVVPDNLQRQWANEILKHCTDFLRVLDVGDKDELPDAPVLAADYDVGRLVTPCLSGCAWLMILSFTDHLNEPLTYAWLLRALNTD